MTDIFELFKKIQTKNTEAPAKPEFILAGLGNPGAKYERTRHNAGFLAIDYYCEKSGVFCNRLKFKSLTGTTQINGHGVLLLKPQTFMNSSGEAVRDACEYYDIPPQKVIVITDDVSFEPGCMRIRRSGSSGGHKGLESIIYQLESDAFPRIRLGVGRLPAKTAAMVDWVLGGLSPAAIDAMVPCFEACRDVVSLIIGGDTDAAMSKYNGMKPEKADITDE